MAEQNKPNWLRASLPYISVATGLFTVINLTPLAALFSGGLLIFTGIFDWYMQRTARAQAGLRNEGASGTRARGKLTPPAPTPPSLQMLVVEDNAATLRLYQLRVASWTFPVTLHTAANGYEGLLLAGEIKPDLLLCDLRMPGVNGVQLVRALCDLERYKDVTIVMVTGMPAIEIQLNGGLPERVEQMGKPIDFDRLQSIAQTLWSQREGSMGISSAT